MRPAEGQSAVRADWAKRVYGHGEDYIAATAFFITTTRWAPVGRSLRPTDAGRNRNALYLLHYQGVNVSVGCLLSAKIFPGFGKKKALPR